MMMNFNEVIPWGRSFNEYQQMFALKEKDLTSKIMSVGDGPAAFNAGMYKAGHKVTSVDPIYALSKEAIWHKILEVKDDLLQFVANHKDQYIWKQIKNVTELEHVRMQSMKIFLEDFETGLAEERYINHALPDMLPFADHSFDLVLSSHFLLLYAQLGFDFHYLSIKEMLRLGKEVRIFPVVNLDQHTNLLINQLVEVLENDFLVTFQKVDYEFQKGADQMMVLSKHPN